MTDTTPFPNLSQSPEIVNLTPELAKSKMLLSLTKAEQSIQGLNDAEAELVYNEDNLEKISKFIADCKKAKSIVETERVAIKEPYLTAGKNIDAGAKLVATEVDAVLNKAHSQYTKLCQEVERKKREAEAERQRVATIQKAMSDFKMDYAVKIAAAKDLAELTSLERLVNLETGNSRKYAEFLPEMIEGCKAIRSLLTGQKEKLRQLSYFQKLEQEAAETGNDEAILEIQDKKEVLEARIQETSINLQETAIGQSVSSQPISVDVILPEIKGVRKYYKWIVVDEKAALKRGWAKEKVVPKDELIDQFLTENKSRVLDETGFIEGGVRFFIEKKY